MLGVVRVFSRKSTIFLADVNSVMNAIQRFNTQQKGHNSRKRSFDKTTSLASANPSISLSHGADTARFDMITLPMRKKFKSATTPQASSRIRSHITHSNQTEPSLFLPDISVPESAQVDVLTAMETIFPSVTVPQIGATRMLSAIDSPASGMGSSLQRRMLYKARDQDITMPQADVGLQTMQFDLFNDDLQISVHSDQIAKAEQNQEFWNVRSGEDDEFKQAFASMSQGPSKSSSEIPSLGTIADTPMPLPIEPMHALEMEPIPVIDATINRAPTTVRDPSAPKKSRTRTDNRRVVVAPTEKRGAKIHIDQVTELSPTQLRDIINDTTDIVMESDDERKSSGRKKGKKSQVNISEIIPSFLASFSSPMHKFWKEVAPNPFPSVQPASADKTCTTGGNGGGGNEDVERRELAVDRRQEEIAPIPLPVAFEDTEALMIPDVIVPSKSTNSAEIQRDGETSGQERSVGQISVHSGSVVGASASASGSGSIFVTRADGCASRDHVLEQVC